MTSHRSANRTTWVRPVLKSLSLPALGMAVMIVAGGAAVSTAGRGTAKVDLPPLPPRPAVFTPDTLRPVPRLQRHMGCCLHP